MLLEGSHAAATHGAVAIEAGNEAVLTEPQRKLGEYVISDTDTYCIGEENGAPKKWYQPGSDGLAVAEELFPDSPRWLTADFRMGDVLLFSVYPLPAE